MFGNIHSIETMGLHDGPGIRTVIFFQGCPLRCKYCHNPDMWTSDLNKKMTVDEIIDIIKPYKNYYKASGGGVTLSGGEVLLQNDFAVALLKRLKDEDIHTCIDTSGYGNGSYEMLLKYTDLVLLDIKASDQRTYYRLTGRMQSGTKRFIAAINHQKAPVLLRQVLLPGINDDIKTLKKLKKFISNNFSQNYPVEFLPFHKMCLEKYIRLGMDFPFKNIEEMSDAQVQIIENEFKKLC